MHKYAKRIIALVLVLTIAISAFVITSTAQSSISRIVRNVSIVVDLIKIKNNHWDEIGHIIGHDSDDIHKEDVEAILGGADLDDVVDVIKQLANAGIDYDEIEEILTGLISCGNKISVSDFIDLITSACDNPGCIDKDLLEKVFGCIASVDVDADNLGDIVKAIVEAIDFSDSNLDIDKFGGVIKAIIIAIKNGVDVGADDSDVSISEIVSGIKDNKWVGAWSTSMTKAAASILQNDISIYGKNITTRNRVTSTLAGNVIRITLSNEFGNTPLKVGEVTAAIGNKTIDRAVDLGTMVKVTFGGKTSVTIPAGGTVKSDPIKLDVKAFDDVVISAYYENITKFTTVGLIGGHCYASLGNDTEKYISAASVDLALENLSVGAYEVIPVLSNIDVYRDDACSAVMFGDSTLTNDIPLLLAKKLHNAGIDNVGVLQQAIKGNELLLDGQGVLGSALGESGLKRFYKDAIAQPGCKYIFVKIGLNDIIHPNCKSKVDLYPDGVQVDKIIAGYKQLIDTAHANGKTIIFFTLTPFKGYTRDIAGLYPNDFTWTQEIEDYAQQVNTWLKSSDCKADYVIDLDSMRDTVDNAKLKADLTLDGIHFTVKGCQTVVDLIPIDSIFGAHIDNPNGGNDGHTDVNLPTINIDTIKDIISGIIKDKDNGAQIGTIDVDALIKLIKQICDCDGSNITIPDGGIKVVIDLITGAIKDPSTGIVIGKIDVDLIKGILDKIGFDYDGLPQIDVIIDIINGIIKLPDGDIIANLPNIKLPDINLPTINIDTIKDIISGIIKDKDNGTQIGTIDVDALIKLIKQICDCDGSNITIPDGGIKVVIDLITGAIKDPSTGIVIGKIDVDLIKGILDKIGFDYDGLPQIDVIIDIINGIIKLPDGDIVANLPAVDPSDILDKFKDIFDKINGNITDGTIPGTADPDTGASDTVDPALDPYVDEALEDVDVITDLVVDDSTPLADVPSATDPSGLDDMEIANTSDSSVAVLVTVATVAGAIFVTSTLKKKED